MSTMVLVAICAGSVLTAFGIARRLVRWQLVVVLMLCGAVLAVATGADRYGEQGKQRLNQWVTSKHAEARQ